MKRAAVIGINVVAVFMVLTSIFAIGSSLLGAVHVDDSSFLSRWAFPPQVIIDHTTAFIEQEICMNYPNPEIEICRTNGPNSPIYINDQLQPLLFSSSGWGFFFMNIEKSLFINFTHAGDLVIVGDRLSIPMLISQLFTWLGVLLIIWNLRSLALKTVESGIVNRFNVKRIRVIVGYVLTVPIFMFLFREWKITFFEREIAKYNFQGLDFILPHNLPLLWMILALIGIALMLVFDRYAKLKSEHELVI